MALPFVLWLPAYFLLKKLVQAETAPQLTPVNGGRSSALPSGRSSAPLVIVEKGADGRTRVRTKGKPTKKAPAPSKKSDPIAELLDTPKTKTKVTIGPATIIKPRAKAPPPRPPTPPRTAPRKPASAPKTKPGQGMVLQRGDVRPDRGLAPKYEVIPTSTSLARSPTQAAKDLLAYARQAVKSKDAAMRLGTKNAPNAFVRAAQRDMAGGLKADGIYGSATRMRGQALLKTSFPPR
jgi:hypothetical protein